MSCGIHIQYSAKWRDRETNASEAEVHPRRFRSRLTSCDPLRAWSDTAARPSEDPFRQDFRKPGWGGREGRSGCDRDAMGRPLPVSYNSEWLRPARCLSPAGQPAGRTHPRGRASNNSGRKPGSSTSFAIKPNLLIIRVLGHRWRRRPRPTTRGPQKMSRFERQGVAPRSTGRSMWTERFRAPLSTRIAVVRRALNLAAA